MTTTDNIREELLFIIELSSKKELSLKKLNELEKKFLGKWNELREEFLGKWFIIEPGLDLVCLAGLGGLIALLPTFMQYFNAVIGVLVVISSCIAWVYAFFEFKNWFRGFLWKKYLRKRLNE